MKRNKLFLILLTLIAFAQTAWAQTYVSNETDLRNAITNGANITLTANIELTNGTLEIGSDTVTIDLNGHKLSRSLTENENYGMVIYNNGGNLTINDSSGDNSGSIEGGRSYNGAGVLCEENSTLTINGGTFRNNDVSRTDNGNHGRGGAIFMNPNTTLTITGGVFDSNSAYNGGAIYIDDGGPNNGTAASATISGGTFSSNTSTDGGAFYNKGTLTINSGTITSNSVTEHGGGGVTNYGTLTINGGTFTNNSGMGNGGGIWSNQNISMQGLVTIKNNTGNGGSTNNFYLSGSDTKINFTGALERDSRIGVSVEKYERKISTGYNIYHQLPANAYFFSDVDTCYVNMNVIEGEIFPKVVDGSNAAIYVERSWTGGNTDGHVVSTPKVATGVNGFHIETDQTLNDGWYQFVGSYEYDDRIVINGDVKFILYDDCDIEFKKGIHINKDRTLTIYAQTAGTGTLRATGDDGSSNNGDAAIGGNNHVMGGNLVIHGGTITANPSHNCAAGIGGGDDDGSGMQSVVIWGGDITAEGSGSGAGIGGGYANRGPSVTIYGGTVTAKGGDYGAGIGGGKDCGNSTITIYGGTVKATGGSRGAGIGGGSSGDLDNPVYIYSGTITAKPGYGGAGIGGGYGDDGGGDQKSPIYIYGGTVTAEGFNSSAYNSAGAGIGGGDHGNGGTVVINGGTVYATGSTTYYAGAGIGGGSHGNGGTVTINGGYVEAWGNNSYYTYASAGIGGGDTSGNGGTVTINGGTVKAGCGTQWAVPIGYGGTSGPYYGSMGSLTIASDMMVTSNLSGKAAAADRVTVCQTRDDSTKPNVTIEACDHSGATYTQNGESGHSVNCTYCSITEEAHAYGSDGITCTKCGYVLPTISHVVAAVSDWSTSKGWAFIASPVTTEGGIAPSSVNGLVAETASHYDLYRLNNTTWENYKAHTSDFKLINGYGYLYASKNGTTLVFVGPFNNGSSMTVDLEEGWNLVGNPFADSAYVDRNYYKMNSEGSTIEAVDITQNTDSIAVCTGIVVQAEDDGQTITFSRATQQAVAPSNGGLRISLTQANTRGNAVMDNAIITFNEGSQLGKFYFGTQNANIYIPQGNQDYAIAFSEGQGEMPLNFKATEDGTYTITINPENVEMGYLHLIDNITGADVDLLALRQAQGPASYTFTAKTTDYESRFKLVFASIFEDADGDSGTFAFFSNGNWIIANEGKATLQVIDINGRILTNETVNGSVSKAINAAPGVYVIRLINGDDVKTQKIVVR